MSAMSEKIRQTLLQILKLDFHGFRFCFPRSSYFLPERGILKLIRWPFVFYNSMLAALWLYNLYFLHCHGKMR
jgi:hypothetical protein